MAGPRRLFGGRAGKFVWAPRVASIRPMIRKIALAALAATAVFQVAVFIQYGTLWGGALASYQELLLVFVFLLATFWVHAPIARLFGADRLTRVPSGHGRPRAADRPRGARLDPGARHRAHRRRSAR